MVWRWVREIVDMVVEFLGKKKNWFFMGLLWWQCGGEGEKTKRVREFSRDDEGVEDDDEDGILKMNKILI